MKEIFTAPELELIRFDTEDVITTSGLTNGDTVPDFGGGSDYHIQ